METRRLPGHQLAINILEASDTDRQNKVYDNANYGLALAASTTDVMPWVEDQDMVLPYTKGWYDAYIAWNMNFVASQGSMILFPKLLIPSVLCTDGQQARAAVSSYIP